MYRRLACIVILLVIIRIVHENYSQQKYDTHEHGTWRGTGGRADDVRRAHPILCGYRNDWDFFEKHNKTLVWKYSGRGGAAARDDGFIFREVLGGRGAFKQTEKNAKESVERRKNPIVKNIKRITCWRRNAEYRNRSSKTYNLRSIIRYTHYR